MQVRLWKVVLGILLVALLVGGGVALYQAGYAHGVMSDVSFDEMPFARDGFEHMVPYYGMPYGMRGYHSFTGFFPLGRMLFGGLILFLVFGAIFRFFGMRHYWAMHRMDYPGEGVPPWMRHGHPYWGKASNKENEDKQSYGEEAVK